MKYARLVMVVLLSISASAQVVAPKHWRKDDDNLEQHYKDISCSLLLVRTADGYGTGFFVSGDGDMATASHVLGQRSYTSTPDGKVKVDLAVPRTFQITDSKGTVSTISANQVEQNGDAWGADVALVKTGIHTKCWLLPPADDKSTVPGEHLMTMGFPGVAFGSLSLYSGIMSARLKLDFISGLTNTGQPVKPENEFIRVQMPISPGLSGSPVINDKNEVVGIVTNAGFSTQRLDFLIQANRQHAFDSLNPPQTADQPGQMHITLNVFSIVAELAETLREFGSPGYGDAVPISYLRKGQPLGH